MTSLRSILIGTAVAGAIAAVPTAASAQGTSPAPGAQLDQLQVPSPVAGYAGDAMWSQYDTATGAFRLVLSRDGGAPQPVGVGENAAPFDVDLGTSRSGAIYAVYTRNGDVYRLRVGTTDEQKLTKLSSPSMTERDPTIQRGEIAFIRRDHGYDQVRAGDTTSGSTGTKLVVKAKDVDSVELGIKQIAYVRSSGNEERVHVRNLSTGHDESVARVGSGGASFASLTKPSFTDDQSGFVWAQSRIGAPGNKLVKYTLRTGKLGYAADRERVASSAWLGDDLGAITSTSLDASLGDLDSGKRAVPGSDCSDAGIQYCSVQIGGPVDFGS